MWDIPIIVFSDIIHYYCFIWWIWDMWYFKHSTASFPLLLYYKNMKIISFKSSPLSTRFLLWYYCSDCFCFCCCCRLIFSFPLSVCFFSIQTLFRAILPRLIALQIQSSTNWIELCWDLLANYFIFTICTKKPFYFHFLLIVPPYRYSCARYIFPHLIASWLLFCGPHS